MCPVVSIPAKNSAAISGNIWLSESCFPVLGSLARSSRSAKLPLLGFTALMWASRFHTMVCMQHDTSVSWVAISRCLCCPHCCHRIRADLFCWRYHGLTIRQNLTRWSSYRGAHVHGACKSAAPHGPWVLFQEQHAQRAQSAFEKRHPDQQAKVFARSSRCRELHGGATHPIAPQDLPAFPHVPLPQLPPPSPDILNFSWSEDAHSTAPSVQTPHVRGALCDPPRCRQEHFPSSREFLP